MKINICDFCGEQIKGDPIKIIPYFQKEDFMETICIPWSEQVNRTYCRKCTADLISLMRMPVETMRKLEEEKKNDGRRLTEQNTVECIHKNNEG